MKAPPSRTRRGRSQPVSTPGRKHRLYATPTTADAPNTPDRAGQGNTIDKDTRWIWD
jgi:hypothetical protein